VKNQPPLWETDEQSEMLTELLSYFNFCYLLIQLDFPVQFPVQRKVGKLFLKQLARNQSTSVADFLVSRPYDR
jgi:hypothetical protein